MKLIIYVHDYARTIGHSRAMIEVIDRLKPSRIKVVCYEHSPIEEIDPTGKLKYEFIKVPLARISPFLLKNLYFQVYTLLFSRLWTAKEDIPITVGICSFNGKIVNIQFSHFLWMDLYFSFIKLSPLKRLYKLILFKYFTICEDYYYKRRDLKFVFLSSFMKEKFIERYSLKSKNIRVAYSSADFDTFRPSEKDKLEIREILQKDHPELALFNPNCPTLLFVGALERKGLPLFIDKVPQNIQIIIVGQKERGSHFKIPSSSNIFYIPFTKKINLLYELADTFIFPTLYEPFGLVLLEAAVAGVNIITTKEMVGASEILEDFEGVTFIKPSEIDSSLFENIEILSKPRRYKLHEDRLRKLNDTNWEECTKEWRKIIEETNF